MNVFQVAAQKKYRFATHQGNLSTEDLFDLPLISSKFGKTDLNNVAISISRSLKELSEESFVEARPNPIKAELETKLEIVKAVIGVKQLEAAAAKAAADKQQKLAALYRALDDARGRELASSTTEDLQRQIEELNKA